MASLKYENLLPRFLKYVKVETRSNPNSDTIPSDPKEMNFLKDLEKELKKIGLSNVRFNKAGTYLLATLPSNVDHDVPAIGLIAHVDTADFNAHNINPQIIEDYDGSSDIQLDQDGEFVLSPTEFPSLKKYQGDTLVTTDGSTLLGADDKSGVAEVITFCEYLINHPEIKHGTIQIGLGTDEEIGIGADHFEPEEFGADFAYTVDGGPLGELEYETFNAAHAVVDIKGKNVHTGVAKGTMINALQLGIDFHNSLPDHDRAERTEGREGFFHLYKFSGEVDSAQMEYLIRDHDKDIFNNRKHALEAVAADINDRLGEERVKVTINDQYYNLRDALKDHMDVVELAKQAMEDLDIKPDIYPVRGGTDGSTISYKGLPTPNLFAGGENMHSRFEYVSAQTMDRVIDVLLEMNKLNVENN